jgi:hypothetical protein
MLGEDDIDITEYINAGYKPIYCTNTRIICELLNPHPLPIKEEDLQAVRAFIKDKNIIFSATDSMLKRKIKYRSSYIMFYDPVDCYDLYFQIGKKIYYLEIRKEVDKKSKYGHLILPTGDPGSRFIVIDSM